MPHLVTCPRCAHEVDTWVAEGETTHCEACGALVGVPAGAELAEEGPPIDVVRERGRLAGLDPAPRTDGAKPFTWSDGTPAGRFARRTAQLVVLVLFLLAVVPYVADLFERGPTHVDLTGLVVRHDDPDAPFASTADLRAAIEAASDEHGCDVVVMTEGFGFAFFEGNTFEIRRLESLLDDWREEGR